MADESRVDVLDAARSWVAESKAISGIDLSDLDDCVKALAYLYGVHVAFDDARTVIPRLIAEILALCSLVTRTTGQT